jgi:hypothetical protein
MAGSPRYKIDNRDGEYRASAKSAREAVQILYGVFPGGKVRDGYWQRILHRHQHVSISEAYAQIRETQDKWAAEHRKKYPLPETENTTGQ